MLFTLSGFYAVFFMVYWLWKGFPVSVVDMGLGEGSLGALVETNVAGEFSRIDIHASTFPHDLCLIKLHRSPHIRVDLKERPLLSSPLGLVGSLEDLNPMEGCQVFVKTLRWNSI